MDNFHKHLQYLIRSMRFMALPQKEKAWLLWLEKTKIIKHILDEARSAKGCIRGYDSPEKTLKEPGADAVRNQPKKRGRVKGKKLTKNRHSVSDGLRRSQRTLRTPQSLDEYYTEDISYSGSPSTEKNNTTSCEFSHLIRSNEEELKCLSVDYLQNSDLSQNIDTEKPGLSQINPTADIHRSDSQTNIDILHIKNDIIEDINQSDSAVEDKLQGIGHTEEQDEKQHNLNSMIKCDTVSKLCIVKNEQHSVKKDTIEFEAPQDMEESTVSSEVKSIDTDEDESKGKTKRKKLKTSSSSEVLKRTCHVCNKVFANRSNLLVHLRIHADLKPYSCTKCNRTFRTRVNAKRHIKTHFKIKDFACPTCGKNFTEKRSVIVHQRIHTGEKPFQCKTCNMRFRQHSSLTNHVLQHTGWKGHICEVCGRAFRQKPTLKIHMLRHAGIKKYNCALCMARFTQPNELMRHLNKHNGIRPFICSQCPRTYTRLDLLKTHIERIHPEMLEMGGRGYIKELVRYPPAADNGICSATPSESQFGIIKKGENGVYETEPVTQVELDTPEEGVLLSTSNSQLTEEIQLAVPLTLLSQTENVENIQMKQQAILTTAELLQTNQQHDDLHQGYETVFEMFQPQETQKELVYNSTNLVPDDTDSATHSKIVKNQGNSQPSNQRKPKQPMSLLKRALTEPDEEQLLDVLVLGENQKEKVPLDDKVQPTETTEGPLYKIVDCGVNSKGEAIRALVVVNEDGNVAQDQGDIVLNQADQSHVIEASLATTSVDLSDVNSMLFLTSDNQILSQSDIDTQQSNVRDVVLSSGSNQMLESKMLDVEDLMFEETF